MAITPDRAAGVLRIRAEAATTGPTGVEMEAMTAASVAALTVYDMVKGVERGVEIRAVRLVSKTGGKSGDVGPPRPPAERRRRRAPDRGPAIASAGRIGEAQAAAADRPMADAPATVARSSSPPATASRPASARTPRARRVAARLAALGFAVERARRARRPAGDRGRALDGAAAPRASSSRPAAPA